MQLMTKEIKTKLLHNNAPQNRDLDHKPVVKFFSPFNGSKWLITEMDSADDDSLFGLCDLGLGFPELGYVSLQELKDLKFKGFPAVERDLHFKAIKPLSHFTKIASQHKRIVA